MKNCENENKQCDYTCDTPTPVRGKGKSLTYMITHARQTKQYFISFRILKSLFHDNDVSGDGKNVRIHTVKCLEEFKMLIKNSFVCLLFFYPSKACMKHKENIIHSHSDTFGWKSEMKIASLSIRKQ